MKFKKILTALLLCMLSFTGLFFGCKDKYKNFTIEINGESSINLIMNSPDKESEKEVLIKISNAPSSASKNISYEVSKANIVKVEKLASQDSNMARFKISALENIISYNPSCVITFKTAEGNKTCTLNVNVEIPITDFKINQDYAPYVVTGGEDYYINTANLIVFEPANTTQRDITYSLKDETLKEKYGLNITESGKISVEKYISDGGVALSSFEVVAKSVQDPTKEKTVTINVFKEITADDILIAYDFEAQTNNPFNSSLNKFSGEKAEGDEDYESSLSYLNKTGITFASNVLEQKEVDFGIFLKNGLDFNKVKVLFEKTTLNNVIIEDNNDNNISNLLSHYKIYSVNPNLDVLNVVISYIGIQDYEFTLSIPINVLEYPINLFVNNSDKSNYNIFDYYEGNSQGQEFNVSVLTAGAFDKKFKIIVDENDFKNLEIRYKNELLDFVTISNMVFDNESSIFIKAKNLTSSISEVELTFYSNIYKDLTGEINTDLVKTLSLNLTPGIKMLDYAGVFQTKNILYLQANKTLDDNNSLSLDYVINSQVGDTSLNEYAFIEVVSGGDLVEIEKLVDNNSFVFTSKDKIGTVKVKLYSENGLSEEEKTIIIYSYYDESKENEKFEIDTKSNNLKVVKSTEAGKEDKFYLGLSKDQNNATIKVINPQNASVYNTSIESSDKDVINSSLLSLEDLTFYLHAIKETTEPITITITLTLFNSNDLVNIDTFVTETLIFKNLYTYNPIESIEKTQKQVVVIDGGNLDFDSLNKELNVLDVEKYLNIKKADNDLSALKVDYIMPSALIKDTATREGDYYFIEKENSPFDKIAFHASKNREDQFDENGEYIFSFTIRIEDLIGSGNYHLVTLKVVLQKHVKPDGIKILNENGYVYLTNKSNFGQINAKVYSDTLKEVTNKALAYKVKTGNCIDVDENGLITIKASGIAEVLIQAKASQYTEDGIYSATKSIYVVVADGSENYPYIYSGSFERDKYYTLDKDLTLNNTNLVNINLIAGLNGNFAYSEYTNLNNKNVTYNLIYSGLESIFGSELKAKLSNLNIVVNTPNIEVGGSFGFIANINNSIIKNVSLTVPQVSLFLKGISGYNVGLMFANNVGVIENCFVNGQVVLNARDDLTFSFGGMVGVNNGKISGKYIFAKKSQIIDFTSTLNITAISSSAQIGGVVGTNAGEISNINAQTNIKSNSIVVGGLVAEFVSGTVNPNNLLFKGTAFSNNENSIVGGIAGKVSINSNFEFLITEFVNINKTDFNANLKGSIVGGLFGLANSSSKINVGYSYVNSLVSFDKNYFDILGKDVGGLIGNAINVNLTAVYSSVTLNGENVGALINNASSVEVLDAYSFSSGANALINSGNNIKVTNTYSTNCENIVNTNSTLEGSNYTSINYTSAVSDPNFRQGNWNVNTNLNRGLPYLIYNKNGVETNLLTIVPEFISANFVTSNNIENNYYQGFDDNIVVINENNENTSAIIYKTDKLTYKIEDILKIITNPSNADISNIKISSSNTNVISVKGYQLNILNTGDTTITISYLQNLSTEVYISVVEKISDFRINNEEFKILKNNTKLFNTITLSNEDTGVYFAFDTDVKESIYYNNLEIENSEIYSEFDAHIFKGLKLVETNVKVIPYYIVRFDGVEYKVLDYTFAKETEFNVIDGATSIYSNARSLEFVEGETINFEVLVKASNADENINLVIFDEDNNKEIIKIFEGEYSSTDFTIYTLREANDSEITLNIALSFNKTSEKLTQDKYFNIVLSPEARDDLSINIDLVVKSSKLINVELNHYSSTSQYYDEYNSIITPSSMPNSKIVAGNLGVLNINLYPNYASLDKIEVVSSNVNGNRINFTQLAFKETEDLLGAIKTNSMVVISNAGSVTNGISLNLGRSILDINNEFKFNGNLYVSTLLPTNVIEDTIFTISVICYFNNLTEFVEYKLDLIAKPLTSINLTNSKENAFYLAKGAELELDINLINFENINTSITTLNFDTKVLNWELLVTPYDFTPTIEVKNLGTIEEPIYKLIVKTDILTPSGLKFEITPKFVTIVDGNEITSYSNKVTIEVVNFVVNSLIVENAENGILDNNLGNISILKALLDVTKCNGDFSSLNDGLNSSRLDEFSQILLEIEALENLISKSNSAFNLITNNNSGNEIYTNIVEGGNYANFTVSRNNDDYLELKGKSISQSNMLLKVNINYDGGINGGEVQVVNNSNIELRTQFILNVKTYSSDDNPLPIKTYQDFISMMEGEDYILLNDLDLPSDFSGISTNIASFDGNNKIININGFNINETSTTSLGLFNNVLENTVIKNVIVNILPTLFYAEDTYYYGLNINAQNLTTLNFGVISGTNAGVITNCKVINNNYRLVNNSNQYKEVVIFINAAESVDLNIGGLVGVNTGYITNSKVGSTTTSNSIKIIANANLAGLVSRNENKIASSYVVNTSLINNAKTKLTGGFVAENSTNASIITSYVEGYVDRTNNSNISSAILDGGIFSTGYIGGFVHLNDGYIKDSYSNIKVTTNKRSAGFVYDNQDGYIETSFSASSNGSGSNNAQSFRSFTGNNEENIVLNNKGIVNCYYLGENLEGDDDDEYLEPANGISDFDDASLFEGFICDNSSSTIWVFNTGSLPSLYDANLKIVSERELIQNTNNNNANIYNYIYINNVIGSINNPIIVTTSQEFLNALTNINNLYSYYFNGKINQTNINYKNIQIVKDIDLSTIIDANNNKLNSTTEVQKLQDIIFAGSLNGNGMNISNVTITAKNNITNYSSFGLFKQIGIESTYNTQGNIVNTYLDEDNCTVIKNLNFDITNISATLTRSVGTLSGEVLNSKLYNININAESDVIVTGSNMVGGVAGRISGNSFVKGVNSNLSVQATSDSVSFDLTYKTNQSKRIYRYAYDSLKDELNNKVNYVGGLFGVVDIYKTVITNYAQQSDGKSYYINANIVRENNISEADSHIQFVKVSGDIKIQGDIVGGLFGYVGTGAVVYDAKFVLQNSNTQNLIADYAVGGIAGENSGYITYATVEHEEDLQIVIDKDEQTSSSSIFANHSNKALIVGGLVGMLKNGILTNSYSKANIDAYNSQYVGGVVGQFLNSNMHHVYSVGEIYAQNEEVSSNGLVTKNKGYAGLIGTVSGFNSTSTLNDLVFVNKNTTLGNFNLAGMVGYNDAIATKITGETTLEDISFGNALLSSNIKEYAYSFYLEKSVGRFENYDNDNWYIPLTSDKETYPILIYNKLGASTGISSESDLRNMLAGGSYTLTNDIFLTQPWEPITFEGGTLTSAVRPTDAEISARGKYYKIYNLNIENNLSSIGFFATTAGCNISNVTFVVGTTFKDYSAERYKNWTEDRFENDKNWNNYFHNGIKVKNESLNGSTFINTLGISVISGDDEGSRFKDLTVEFKNNTKIETNLQNVGGIVGHGKNSIITGCTVKDLQIIQDSSKKIETSINAENRNSQKIGGIIGFGEDIQEFNDNIIVNSSINLKGGDHNNAYIGFVAGDISFGQGGNIDIDNIQVIGNKNEISNDGAKNVYIGGFAGNINHQGLISNINLENTSIISKSQKTLNSLYAGGLFGFAKINRLENIHINSTNSLAEILTENADSGEINTYIGGLIGYALGQKDKINEISSILCFNNINARLTIKNNANIGGIIGQNGDNNNFGLKINNLLAGNFISIREANILNADNGSIIGGIIGKNWKNSISNVGFIGKARLIIRSFDKVGALIGSHVGNNGYENETSTFNEDENCFFVEDLNQIASRKIEFGKAISYVTFIEKINNSENEFNRLIYNILKENELNAGSDTIITLLSKDVKIDGNDLVFTEGSLFNPIKMSMEDDGSISYSFEDITLLNSNENIYFSLEENISMFTNEDSYIINEFKGNILGNGYTITLNKTFANTISEKSLVSSLTINLDSQDKVEINGKEYNKGFTNIIANVNHGTIYNILVVGNLFDTLVENNIAVIVDENYGFISNTISNVNLIIKVSTTTELDVSGFVGGNAATIYNSISCGNIEIFESSKDDISEYHVNSTNKLVKNLAGFANSNRAFITNVISAITLPIKEQPKSDKPYNYDIINDTRGFTFKSYVDYFANGDYKSSQEGVYKLEDDNYKNLSELIDITCNEENKIFVTNWSQSLGVLYGYSYPTLKIYTDTEDEKFDFFKTNLSTKTDDGTYLINNFGVLNYTLDSLLEDSEVTEIKMEQISTFKGAVTSKYKKTEMSPFQDHEKFTYMTKEITKPFNYDGKGYSIVGLNSNATVKDGNIYSGLFFNTSGEFAIEITNLAISNANFKTQKQITEEDDSETLKGDIYLGAIMAYAEAETNISNCYIDGVLSINDAEGEELVVGGLVGKINKGKITNCVSNVQILLKDLKYSQEIKTEEKEITFKGFESTVGGIVGWAKDAKIINNYALKDILVSTSISLDLGGIVGYLESGELKDNLTISKPAYNGAYLHYYKNTDSEESYYNINAVVGKFGSGETNGNLYNSKLSFVGDKNLSNAEKDIGEIFTTLENSYLADETLNPFMRPGISQMVKLPTIKYLNYDINGEIKTDDSLIENADGSFTLTLENDTIYLSGLAENSEISFDTSNILELDINGIKTDKAHLINTTILFTNKVITYVDKTLFEILESCTISNLEIRAESKLSGATLANTIENTQLYKIEVDDVYVSHTSGDAIYQSMGMLVNTADTSYLNNISINKGRLEINGSKFENDRIGAVVGFALNTLIQESINDATITAANLTNENYVGGIIGYSASSSVFNCTNNGLIYVKGDNNSQIVSGIANNATISFSTNNAKIKGVNSSTAFGAENTISGIGNISEILYSVNKGTIMSISNSKISTSNGIASSSRVYYSYNHGLIVSTDNIYTISDSYAYISYNIGNGFSENSVDPYSALQGFSYIELLELTPSNRDREIAPFAKVADMVLIKDDNIGIRIPYIRLIDSKAFSLKTTEDGSTYLISNAFELWYWGLYGAQNKNVKLVNEIDMTGYEYISKSTFSGTFDGNYYSIKNLELQEKNGRSGFILENTGTIKNINFENPVLEIFKTSISTGDYYLSLVTGKNSGTISNILISSTNGEGFMGVNYQAETNGGGTTNFYIGLISGYNSGTIQNCEVICLNEEAIKSDISLTNSNRALNNLEVNIGGISGFTSKRIVDCIVIAAIKSSVYNSTTFADIDILNDELAGNLCVKFGYENNETNRELIKNIISEMLFVMYSNAHQNIGKIVGKGSYSNCYSVTNEDGEDKFLIVSNINGRDVTTYGNQSFSSDSINDTIIGALASRIKVAGVQSITKPKVAISALLKARKVLKGIDKIGDFIKGFLKSNWVTLIIDLAIETYQIGQQIQNNQSNKLIINDNNEKDANSVSSGLFEKYDFNDSYVKLFSSEYGVSTAYYNAFTQCFGNTNKNFPLLSDFLKLSKTQQEIVPIQNAYYVYNENQLAYALTQNNTFDIILMDNIDMSNKIWDNELTTSYINKHNIINNGFKTILGSNKTKLSSISLKLNTVEFNDKSFNEFGFNDKVKVNKVELAYENFNERFSNAYLGNSSAINGKNYYINNVQQVEIIADALNTYVYDDNLHLGINLNNINFILERDLNLSNSNINEFDKYNYKFATKSNDSATDITFKYDNEINSSDYIGAQIVYQDNRIEEGYFTRIQLNGKSNIKNINFICERPSFIKSSTETILLSNSLSDIQIFAGSLTSNSKYTITLKEGHSLFNSISNVSTISNIKVKPKLNSNTLNLSNLGTTFGFVVSANLGTIKNVELDLSELDLRKIKYDVDFVDIFSKRQQKYTAEGSLIDEDLAMIEFKIGLICGYSVGSIEDIILKGKNDFNISNNLTINFDNKKVSISEGDNYVERDITNPTIAVDYDFGLIVGHNLGTTARIELDSYYLKLNKLSINGEYYNNLIETTYNIMNAGLISGRNEFDINNNSKISDIKITNSKFDTTGFVTNSKNREKNDYVGLISGYSTVSFDNCIVFNSTDGIVKSSLTGMFAPSLYSISKTVQNEDGNSQPIAIYVANIPSINNCISDGKLYGDSFNYKLITIKTEDGGESVVTTQILDDLHLSDTGEPEYNLNNSITDNAKYFYTDINKFNASLSNYGAETPNVNESLTISIDSNLVKTFALTRNITRTLRDANGVVINNDNIDNYSNEIANDNSFMRLVDISTRRIIVDMIKNGGVYTTNNVTSLSQLGLSVESIINGRQNATGDWQSNTGSVNGAVIINGAIFAITSTVTGSCTQDANGNYTLKVTYSSALSTINANSGDTFGDIASAFGSNINFKLIDGYDNLDQMLASTVTSGKYVLIAPFGEFTVNISVN